MFQRKIIITSMIAIGLTGCAPRLVLRNENKTVPESFSGSTDTNNSAKVIWRNYFTDPYLTNLIDTALKYNQELNITLQEIDIAQNEVRARKGEYLPFVNLQGGAGTEKQGRYTRNGSVESNLEIAPGKEFPEPLPDYMFGATASWEIDVWKKLRNAKKAATYRYLSSIEGRNFMITNIVSEIANSYYELLALDNQLENVRQNINIQLKALETVKLQKQAAKVTELAVRKFEAEVFKNQSRQFEILRDIAIIENRINYLVGGFPRKIERNSSNFMELNTNSIMTGIPSQLMENRPDIRQAEMDLLAAKLDIKVARAHFYPSIGIKAGIGFQSYDAKELLQSPESMVFSLAGDLIQPLINRNAIKAMYFSANARQIQAVYGYEQSLRKAYMEVANQLSKINNLDSSIALKGQQVEALTRSIDISTTLFQSARADYMEVLMTQRDALEARMELIEIKMQQMHAKVNIYQALGGGWR